MIISKIVLIIIQIAALVFFIAYIDLLSFCLFIFSILLPIILFIISKTLKRKVSGEIISNTIAANKGDDIKLTINIKNYNKIPIISSSIKICCYNTLDRKKQFATISIPLQPNNTHSIIFTVASQYCGKLIVCFDQIRIYDFVKLFSSTIKSNSYAEIVILPQPKSINAACSGINTSLIDSDRFSKFKAGDDPSEIFDMRDFAEGDRLNRIHWKLSSKSDKLIVKEYSYAINCSILILVDFFADPTHENNIAKIDALVELTLSLSEIILLASQPFNVGWYSQRNDTYCSQFIENDEDFAVFLGRLFEDGAYNYQSNATNEFIKNLDDVKYSHIIYITPKINQENLDLLKYNCNADEKTLLYITDKPAEISEEALRELAFDLPYIIVPHENIENFTGELII